MMDFIFNELLCCERFFLPTLKFTSKALRSTIQMQTKAERFIADAGRCEKQQIMKINFKFSPSRWNWNLTNCFSNIFFINVSSSIGGKWPCKNKSIWGLINFSCCKKKNWRKTHLKSWGKRNRSVMEICKWVDGKINLKLRFTEFSSYLNGNDGKKCNFF